MKAGMKPSEFFLHGKTVRGRFTWIAVIAALVILATQAPAFAQSITITGPNRSGMLEGESYNITWNARGARSVSIAAKGVRTPLGEKSRGRFQHEIASGVPAGRRSAKWRVPWIDSTLFTLKAKAYNAQGRVIASDTRTYRFRPAVLKDRMEDGIYLDLHNRTKQRLYRQKNYRITHAYLSSSSERYSWRRPGSHISASHDHAGVFSVLEKKRSHWSSLFNVEMPYAMRYHGGHFIHATSPNLYRHLGTPASAGCNRLTRHDARQLYHMTPLGTRVEIIGPDR